MVIPLQGAKKQMQVCSTISKQLYCCILEYVSLKAQDLSVSSFEVRIDG